MRIWILTLVLGVALFAVPSWQWFEICLLFADMSFAAFVQSLIAASERYSRLEPVGNYLITMIDRYQDCVKACEHQHSKRAEERTADSYIRKQICMYHCYRIVPFFDILNALHQINLIFSKFTKFIIKNISNLWRLLKQNYYAINRKKWHILPFFPGISKGLCLWQEYIKRTLRATSVKWSDLQPNRFRDCIRFFRVYI